MPTDLDLELVPEAAAIIEEVGLPVTYQSRTGAYDPSTGDVTETIVEYTLTASPILSNHRKYVADDIWQEGDGIIYIAGQDLTFTPKNDDAVIMNSEEWIVVGHRRLMTGEQAAAWRLHVRQ